MKSNYEKHEYTLKSMNLWSRHCFGISKTTNNLQAEAAMNLWFAPLERAQRSGKNNRSPACLLCGKVPFQFSIQISDGATVPQHCHVKRTRILSSAFPSTAHASHFVPDD